MLSRSNFSIRRLMPQRRQNSDDDLFWDNDEKAGLRVTDGIGSPCPSLKTDDHKHRGSRWISKSSTKKIPQPIIVLRHSEEVHRITNIPPLPDTPHSSKSSLCSCEHHAAGFASPRRLPRNGSPGFSPGHASMRSKTVSARRISPPPGSPLENPRPSPRLPTEVRKNKSVKSLPSPTKLTFDLLEALEIQPDNEEMTIPMPIMPPTPPKRKSTPSLDRELEGPSENVQQLIREADEAFKSATSDVTGEGRLDFEISPAVPGKDTVINVPLTRPPLSPPASTSPRPSPKRRIASKKSQSKPVLSPLKSPTRSGSVSKSKRQKSQKSRNGRKARPPPKKQRSKWSVSAKELLPVRLFGRLEVDEVLSPTRLQEIRMSRVSSLVPKRSSETLRTIQSDGSDTPVDPFILQDLPTRIGAAGVRLSIPSPIVEVSTPRSFDFNIADRRRSSVKDEEYQKYITQDAVSQQPRLKLNNHPNPNHNPEGDTMPVPPAKNPLRFAAIQPPKSLPHLPSIPEVMVTTPENFTLSPSSTPKPRSRTRKRKAADEADPYIYLPSTRYTLTAPTFSHGPIRIAKEDVALLAHSSSKLATTAAAMLAADDSLDWTAFQMAILGGAGDLYGEATDYSRRSAGEEDEVRDLCEWFAGFGFDGCGRLDSGTATPASTPLGEVDVGEDCSPVSTVSSLSSGMLLPIPVEKEFPGGFWGARSGEDNGAEASSRFERGRSVGLRRWTVEGHPKRYEGSVHGEGRRPSDADSVASLPQSPMLDLVVSRDSDGNEYIVPMGYNLGHDLGDFLRWEAENVYVSEFGQGEDVEAELPA